MRNSGFNLFRGFTERRLMILVPFLLYFMLIINIGAVGCFSFHCDRNEDTLGGIDGAGNGACSCVTNS
jgi:hypothetical protein